jgi:hypothetical protein
MQDRGVAVSMMSILLAVSAYAANLFFDATNDKPVSANFRGTEWGEDISQEEIALAARVFTTRIARMPWGAIFKIEFTDIKSHAPKRREITAEYFVVTDDRIVLLNQENIDEAVQRIAAMDKPPSFDEANVYGITRGQLNHEEGLWKTTIRLKGDPCVYEASHPSGHFKKVVWKKGVGLVEYSSGYGAMKNGFRLKREK